MLPDIICIGIILFFVCAMLVSDKDSRKWAWIEKYAFMKHLMLGESDAEFIERIKSGLK